MWYNTQLMRTEFRMQKGRKQGKSGKVKRQKRALSGVERSKGKRGISRIRNSGDGMEQAENWHISGLVT